MRSWCASATRRKGFVTHEAPSVCFHSPSDPLQLNALRMQMRGAAPEYDSKSRAMVHVTIAARTFDAFRASSTTGSEGHAMAFSHGRLRVPLPEVRVGTDELQQAIRRSSVGQHERLEPTGAEGDAASSLLVLDRRHAS